MSSSPPAQGSSPRFFSSQISPDLGIQRMSSSPRRRPGRNWLCRREALLPLARSYRMKGMLRAGLYCCIHRGSIAVRIVIVRQREEGGELSLYSTSVNAMSFRGMIAVATVKDIESRVADRGFCLQTGRAVKAFSCGRAGDPTVATLDTTAVPLLVARFV